MSRTELRLVSCPLSFFAAGFIANIIKNGIIYGGETEYLLVLCVSPFTAGLISLALPWELFSKNDPPDFDLILKNVVTSVLIGVGIIIILAIMMSPPRYH